MTGVSQAHAALGATRDRYLEKFSSRSRVGNCVCGVPLPSLRGYRGRVLRHARKFLRHYRGTLNPLQLYAAGLSAMLICTTSAASSPLQKPFRRTGLTYFGPTERLDAQYTPTIRMAASYEAHFRPTMVSDASGGLAEDLAEDLA